MARFTVVIPDELQEWLRINCFNKNDLINKLLEDFRDRLSSSFPEKKERVK